MTWGGKPGMLRLGHLDDVDMAIMVHATPRHRTGSTDMGDRAQVMPILHPYVGGATGTSHGADWQLSDHSLVYLTNAKALASMVVDLLADGAAVGREVVVKAKPPMTRAAYLDFQRRASRREVYEG